MPPFAVILAVGNEFTVIVIDPVVAHCPDEGVNVYDVVAVLFNAGDHVPFIPFVDVVGKDDKLVPEHIEDTWLNVGVTGVLTETLVELDVEEHPFAFVTLTVYEPELVVV